MAFAFTRKADVEDQVRRIAVEQVDKALEEGRSSADFDQTVHGLRRRCKKLRGLLRLVEPRFEGFATENRAVRDAAEGLSGTRDAAVMIETFEALRQFDRAGNRMPRIGVPVGDMVSGLLESQVASAPEAVARQQLLSEFCASMEEVGARARGWSIGGRRFGALASGLELTYRRLTEGMASALSEETAEALHDWRKHTKYHWHHVSLLQRAAPDVLNSPRDLLNQLGELLGDHHNLHVLGERLAAQRGSLDGDGIDAVQAVIAEHQAVLAKRAFVLGRQLAAEKPGALRRRFAHYWQLLPEEA